MRAPGKWAVLAILLTLAAGSIGTAAFASASTAAAPPAPRASGAANTTVPTARTGAMMAYDPIDHATILFGGEKQVPVCPKAYYNDTWEFQAGIWTQLHPKSHPSLRFDGNFVYDPAIKKLVLFGGQNCYSGTQNDTWTFSGGVWTNITSHLSPSPPQLVNPGMTYDAADHYLLLFGTGSTLLTSGPYTFTLSNGSWTALGTGGVLTPSPAARFGAALQYDSTDGYAVLFGGELRSTNSVYNDTWTFHAGTWTNITANLTAAPGPRNYANVVWDARDGYLLLSGGAVTGIHADNDSWSFVGGVWTNLTAGRQPPARYSAAIAYDGLDRYVVLFGGQTPKPPYIVGDEWKYVSGVWKKV